MRLYNEASAGRWGRSIRHAAVVALLLAGWLTGTAHAQTTDRATLEQQIDALEAELSDLDGRIRAQQAVIDAAVVNVDAVKADLDTNQQMIDAVAVRREVPAAAHAELVLVRFIQGDPATAAMTEFVETGELDAGSLRKDRLYDAAEEHTRTLVARLDAETARLQGEREAIRTRLDQALTAVEAARAELVVTQNRRGAAATELDSAKAELKGLLALSPRGPLNGAVDYPIRPAIGIKIDNGSDARPQTGLSRADVVYDIIVEGGITRFLAVFHSQDVDRIGPVRSARTSDISIMAAYNNPIFAYSGGNDGVLAAVRVAPMVSLTESSAPAAFVRDDTRYAPVNLYTSTGALYAQAASRAGVPNAQFAFRLPGEPATAGRPAGGVTIDIGFETVTYTWNGTGWDRATNGRPTLDTAAGQVSPRNVVVQFTNYSTSPADAASPDALTVGSGTAWVLTDGRVIEGRWARGIGSAAIQYLDPTNTPIPLTPDGQTWVELPRPGGATLN